jgi:hypothetical protein
VTNWGDIDPTAETATADERVAMIMELILQTLDSLPSDTARRIYLAHVAFGVPLSVLRSATGESPGTIRLVLRTADSAKDSLLRTLVDQVGALIVTSPDLRHLARRLGVLSLMTCPVCGAELTLRSRGRRRRYCSDPCRQSAHRNGSSGPRADFHHAYEVAAYQTRLEFLALPENARGRLLSEVPGDLAAALTLQIPPDRRPGMLKSMPRTRFVALLRALPAKEAAVILARTSISTATTFATAEPTAAAGALAHLEARQAATLLSQVRVEDLAEVLARMPRRLAGYLLIELPVPDAVLSGMVASHVDAASDLLFHVPETTAVSLLITVRRDVGGALLDAMSARRAATLLVRQPPLRGCPGAMG